MNDRAECSNCGWESFRLEDGSCSVCGREGAPDVWPSRELDIARAKAFAELTRDQFEERIKRAKAALPADMPSVLVGKK